jgi:hypothetical protein
VQISIQGGEPLEGIMLDLSQTGMDVLAARNTTACGIDGCSSPCLTGARRLTLMRK